MDIKQDEIYDGLKNIEMLLEKSFPILPFYLSAVKVDEVNRILKQIYECLPSELKNTECNVYNLLKQFEFTLNNSFPILQNYLVAVRINKLKQIIDQIYATMPSTFGSIQSTMSIELKCDEQRQPSTDLKLLISLGEIIKRTTPILQMLIVGALIVYILGIDKCYGFLLEIMNKIRQ